MVWETCEGYQPLEAKLDKYSNALVTGRSFLGHYKGKGLDKGKASYSFRYFIGSSERTLSGDEIDELQKEFFAFLESEKLELR